MRRYLCQILISFFTIVSFDGSVSNAAQELTLLNQFSTSGGIGLAFDPNTDTLWTYGSDTIRQYDQSGNLLNTFADAPDISANDADLDFADVSFTLGTTFVPAGTLLFTNGESGVAEVYAIDSSATLLGSLSTNFGNSHVVGSAYSPLGGSLFLVQDKVPSDVSLDNLVAEVDPVTGAVLNSFDLDTIAPDFNINFGDLEVSSATGEIFLVSSDESSILQLSSTGVIIQELTIASGSGGSVSGSGIALDDARNEIYVQTNGGTVYRFAIVPEPGDFDMDGDTDGSDFLKWQRSEVTDPPAVSDLLDWENGYGDNALLSGGLTAVPEPGSWALFTFGSVLLGCRKRWA